MAVGPIPLIERGRPELATEQMHQWGTYLRDQADMLGLPVIDTSELSIAEVCEALRREVVALHAGQN